MTSRLAYFDRSWGRRPVVAEGSPSTKGSNVTEGIRVERLSPLLRGNSARKLCREILITPAFTASLRRIYPTIWNVLLPFMFAKLPKGKRIFMVHNNFSLFKYLQFARVFGITSRNCPHGLYSPIKNIEHYSESQLPVKYND